MLSQTINLIATPFITGLVGYGTNWLAIKMLFRPHRRTVWSLGWQGVIPKNRAKLAKEIGVLVGDKLLRREDINSAFFSENVQRRLEKAVEHELRVFMEKDFGNLNDIISRSGYRPETIVTVLLTSLNNNGALDNMFKEIASGLKDSIYSYKIGSLAQYGDNISSAVHNILSSKKMQEEAGNAISASINNFVMSGKSLADMLPENLMNKIPDFAGFLTDKILVSLETAFDDAETRSKIAGKLVDMKNNHFSDGVMDQMKLGFLNMFLNEDTIKDIVNKYVPSLIKSVKESDSVRDKIKSSISGYIDATIKKPLYMHADSIGLENLFSLKSSLVTAVQRAIGTESFAERISGRITDFIRHNPDKTLGELIEAAGIGGLIDEKIETSAKADITSLSKAICNVTANVELNNVYRYIPKKVFAKIKTSLIKQINKIVDRNLENIIQSVDFPKITEKRINSLDLYEVETLLFSFMNDSFKWINILGFVIGFALGAIQSIIMLSA